MTEPAEALVILRPGTRSAFEARQPRTVLHAASERVLVMELDTPDALISLQDDPAVRWAGTSPPPEILAGLEDDEQLLVAGWLRRRAPKPERPGEGLPWDAPGRLPPDPPRDPDPS